MGLVAPAALADTAPPVIAVSFPQDYPQNIFERGEELNPAFDCQDPGPDPSGIASCTATGDLTPEGALDTATLGDGSFDITAIDNAGNSASRSVPYRIASEEVGPGSGVTTDDEDDGATPSDPLEAVAARGNGILKLWEDETATAPQGGDVVVPYRALVEAPVATDPDRPGLIELRVDESIAGAAESAHLYRNEVAVAACTTFNPPVPDPCVTFAGADGRGGAFVQAFTMTPAGVCTIAFPAGDPSDTDGDGVENDVDAGAGAFDDGPGPPGRSSTPAGST